MKPLLSVEALEKYYGNENGVIVKAVDDLSFKVSAGEFVAVMGPSGSGKTTLLNLVAAVDHPSCGDIWIGGEDLGNFNEDQLAIYRGQNLGYIFQAYNLIDTLTVYENIALALINQKADPDEIKRRVTAAAKRLSIADLLNKYPYEISGGQQQRCACARAVIKEPKLILADEPTGALDSASAKMLMNTLEMMNQEMATTILLVTHDPVTASFCKRVLFLKDGKLSNEIIQGSKDKRTFFNEILDMLSIWGGGFYEIR